MANANGEAVLIDFGFARHAKLPDPPGRGGDLRRRVGAVRVARAAGACEAIPAATSSRWACFLYQLVTGELPFGDPAT